MPIGSPNLFGVQSQNTANVGTLTGSTAFSASAQTSTTGSNAPSAQAIPIGIAMIVVLYLVWAILIRHEKINAQLQPANVAVNIHNILVITFTAILGILLLQLVSFKATILGVPGASTLGRIVSAV